MAFSFKSVLTSAAVAIVTLSSAPILAQTQALLPVKVYDTSIDGRAAFDQNLTTLGVRIDIGEQFSHADYIEAKRIMKDQSNLSLKKARIENLVNNGNQFNPFDR